MKTASGLTKPDLISGSDSYTHTANRLDNCTYDSSGNILSDGTWTFTYDQRHQLVSISDGSAVIAEYFYDAFGRRVKKVAGGETTCFIYNASILLIEETDGNGNALRDYVYLNGEPAAMKVYGDTDAWYWFLNDHLGTPQVMVNAAGLVVWEAGYLPFGEARIVTAGIENNLRFPGQYYDAETGLHYNFHRYYNPATGRYITADPIGLEGGINLYAYVSGNPVNLVDLNGLIEFEYASKSAQDISERFIEELRHNPYQDIQDIIKYIESVKSSKKVIIYNKNDCRECLKGVSTCTNAYTLLDDPKYFARIIYDFSWFGPIDDNDVRPPIIGFLHEIVHLRDYLNGNINNFLKIESKLNKTNAIEYYPIKFENLLRTQYSKNKIYQSLKIRQRPRDYFSH